MSRIRLILIPPSASLPASCLMLDAQGNVLTRGLIELGGPAPEPMRTVAIVPGVDVLIRWLELPSGGPAQAAAVAVHRLRDDLAVASDRLAVALGSVTGSHGRRLVAVVAASLLEAWGDYLTGLGVRPDVMIPDSLILPEPAQADSLIAATFGADLALRGHGLALSIQPDLAEAVAAGRSVHWIAGTEEIERLLAAAALRPPINLLGGTARRIEADRRGWRRAAALAVAVVISPLVLTLAAAGHDEWRAYAAEQRADTAARTAYPDIAPETDAASEAIRRLAAAPPPGGISGAVGALFTSVEAVEGAELDALATDEGMLRATVTYPAYQDLDALKRKMATFGMALIEDSSIDDQGKVVSEVRVGGA